MSNFPKDQKQDQGDERAMGDDRAMQQEVDTLVDVRKLQSDPGSGRECRDGP